MLAAGNDRNFRDAGYIYPKNLIEVHGRPVIEHVIRSFDSLSDLNPRYHFLVRKEEIQKSHTQSVIKLILPGATVIPIPGPTAGAACTALWAIDQIDNDDPLLITNGDQLLFIDYSLAVRDFQRRNLDGGILVFEAVHPRWSYVKVDDNGFVIEAAEKRPISRLATAGTYYFQRGRDFIRAAQSMLLKQAHVDDVFYVCPAYNELVLELKKIGTYNIEKKDYYQIKSPRALQDFEQYLSLHGE
ncbi:MAG: glycosyltransferase family 2 protein [Leptospiraceae bacterium]|nr:glycosyltransferase family 2 protein [Leptospiraceae bacterium]